MSARCLTLTAPFTCAELIARGVTPDAADELVRYAARLLERDTRRHAPVLEDAERDASPHRFARPS
jgi:CBS-domain-containing membrane protein